jgi:hypothetical protein
VTILGGFLAGLITGSLLSWLHFRATLRTYRNYIYDRIENTTICQPTHLEQVGPADVGKFNGIKRLLAFKGQSEPTHPKRRDADC